MLHLTLLCVATDLPMKNFSFDIRVMEHGGDGARRATGRAGDGGTAGDGDATRDGPHAEARLFSDAGRASSIVSDRCAYFCCFIR